MRLEMNNYIKAQGFNNNNEANKLIESGLGKDGAIAITPMGKILPANAHTIEKSGNLGIFVFNFKTPNKQYRGQQYTAHLSHPWVKEAHTEERRLDMRSGTKRQVHLPPGEHTFVNQKTKKTFKLFVETSVTVTCGTDKAEF